MKKNLFVFSLLSAVLCFCATSSAASTGNATKTFNVGAFDKLEAAAIAVDVRLGQPTGKVEISVDGKSTDEVTAYVEDRTLKIAFRKARGSQNKSVHAVITVPSLREIEGEASARVTVNGTLRTQDIEIDLSSSASVQITRIETETLEADASSSASVTIGNLTAKKVEVDASSSATVIINGGTADYAEFDASSSAKINATPFKVLRGSADATSSARIKCSIKAPTHIKQSSSGSVQNL